MKVQELMSRQVASCTPDASLHDVARIMRDHDCGFLPIVDPGDGKLRGVLTDRDAYLAAYAKDRPLSELKAHQAMSGKVWTCREKDDVGSVHESMRQHQVRRMVVVDGGSKPVGVISLNDLALHARAHGRDESLAVASTLGEICKHRAPAHA